MRLKKIENNDQTKYDIFYSYSKAETIINDCDIDDVFESIYITVISNKQKSLGKGSGWITNSVIDHNVNILKYNPLAGSSYTKLPNKSDYPRKALINIQNIDGNEYFKWCLVRYLHLADDHPTKIRKPDKGFAKELDFKDISF